MTNEQILKQAIEKAVKNGWYAFGTVIDVEKFTKESWKITTDFLLKRYSAFDILFSHDFAKAFARYLLKEKADEIKLSYRHKLPAKQSLRIEEIKNWLLQQMVLEKEPLQYLKKFL